jgi:nucleoside-diphosphate-sugar epimerase
MEGVLDRINPEKTHLVAASSTSVYPDWNMHMLPEHGGMGEPSGAAGKALRIFEQRCIDRIGADTTILRFAGLYGADRHPVKFFAGRKAIQGGMQRVNMVSLDRCLAVLDVVLHRPVWGQILNVCDPGHPTRQEFYTQAAKERGLDIPEFADDGDEPYGRVVIPTDLD